MEQLFREWALVIGLAFLFVALEFPLLLLGAAVVIIIWKLLSKSTLEEAKAPRPVEEEEKDSDFIPAEKTEGPQSETEGPECKKSDAFYSGVSEQGAIYNKSARFVTPERPIEKSIE